MIQDDYSTIGSLSGYFLNSLNQHPNRHALYTHGKYYTYQELFDKAQNISSLLNTEANEICALYTNRQVGTFAAILATLFKGNAFVPLSTTMPIERSANMFNQSGAKTLIVDKEGCLSLAELLNKVTLSGLDIILIDADKTPEWVNQFPQHQFICRTHQSESLNEINIANRGPCYLLYTSGSTGTPKGVMISHRSICQYIRSMISCLQPNCHDRFSQITDLTFDVTIHEMFVCWSVGACLYPIQTQYLMRMGQFIHKHRINFMAIVPSTLLMLENFNQLRLEYFKHVRSTIFGGEALTGNILKKWRAVAPHSVIENHYGPTEAAIGFTRFPIPNNYICSGIIPIGHPLTDQRVLVLNADGDEVPESDVGELYLSGSQVASAYWKNNILSHQRFIKISGHKGTWYRTGDLVRNTAQYGLEFISRTDEQYQVKGCRVEKKEVERILKQAADTEMVAVVPYPVSEDGHVLGLNAFIYGSIMPERDLKKKISQKLPDIMVPKRIYNLDYIPLNRNGKVDYMHLSRLAHQYACNLSMSRTQDTRRVVND